MELLKRISGYTLISAITGAISFLLLPVLTSYLSPEDYGVLSIFNASTRFLVALIPLGMGNVLLVYLIEKKDEFPQYLKAFLTTTFILSISITLLIALSYLFITDFFGLPLYLSVALPIIALMVLFFETLTSYFVYLKQFKQYAKLTLSKFFIEIILVLLLVVFIPFNWQGRITALIISLILMVGYGAYYFHKNKLLNKTIKVSYHSKNLLKNGFPLIFMGISIMIMNLSDRFFIEHYIGLEATGLYGIASTVAGILLMIIGASMNVIRPLIYEKLKDSDYKYLVKLALKYLGGLLITTLILLVISKLIFKFMIAENFKDALILTYPLIFGLFFWGIFNYFVSYFMYKNQNKIIGIITFLGILINLILNYFFILKYEAIGAAYATLITYITISILIFLCYLFLPKTTN